VPPLWPPTSTASSERLRRCQSPPIIPRCPSSSTNWAQAWRWWTHRRIHGLPPHRKGVVERTLVVERQLGRCCSAGSKTVRLWWPLLGQVAMVTSVPPRRRLPSNKYNKSWSASVIQGLPFFQMPISRLESY
jgi:hypothetical protein